jgi:signal transduction histidine kinase
MASLSRGFWLAATLILLAVAAPCAAWYVAGNRTLEEQSAQLQRVVRDRGHRTALGLAERLRGRLEAMATAESLRPFYYFQSSFEDPTSTCECSTRAPSPLAAGPTDPFIETYFQIDSDHQLTLPLREATELGPRKTELQTELSASTVDCMRAVDLVASQPIQSHQTPWLAGLRAGDAPLVDTLASDPHVKVDPFQWHGIDLASGPALIALRRVEGTQDHLVQGFVLSRAAVQSWLDATEWPSQLRPIRDGEELSEEVRASIPLECTRWEVAVRVDEGLMESDEQAAQLRAGFRRNFALGTSAAWVTALALLSVLAWRERSERQRSSFAAAAAHELRTPIAGLRLYAEMLADPSTPDAKRQDYAQRIAGEAQRLGRVVTNVLTFTQLERGSSPVSLRSVDLGEELDRILSPLREALSSAGAELVIPSTWPELEVEADPDALEHILRNLIDNAEKYSRESRDRRVHVELLATDNGTVVQVRDHGPGVDPAVGDRIFRAFQRGGDRTQPAGLGLGLMLAHSLASAQRARLEWRNEASGGACFSVHFHHPA